MADPDSRFFDDDCGLVWNSKQDRETVCKAEFNGGIDYLQYLGDTDTNDGYEDAIGANRGGGRNTDCAGDCASGVDASRGYFNLHSNANKDKDR